LLNDDMMALTVNTGLISCYLCMKTVRKLAVQFIFITITRIHDNTDMFNFSAVAAEMWPRF